MKIGAQFYTIRNFCKTLDDLSESLKKVADIGYRYIQVSGTCKYDADWLKNQLDRNGLKCVLTHTPGEKLRDDLDNAILDHKIIDCKYIGLGWNNFTEDEKINQLDSFINTYKPIANKIKNSGNLFMYHNHDMEFMKLNGKTILEYISEKFDPDELGFTLDTFWIQAGGGDPAFWIEKLSGRVPCIHLKDYKYGKKMAVLGEGNINFDRVFEKAESSGTKYMLVEQDECYDEDPFECLKRSYEYLKYMGF